jgi:hypothetical protein
MSDFTKQEISAINKAWSIIERWTLQDLGGSAHASMSEALKHERRGRGLHYAKALLIDCVRQGYTNPNKPISELVGIAMGCQAAYVVGATIRRDAKPDDEDMRAILAAVDTMRTERERRMAEWRARDAEGGDE